MQQENKIGVARMFVRESSWFFLLEIVQEIGGFGNIKYMFPTNPTLT